MAVAERLLGGARSGGMDLVSLQHWLLRFGAASGELILVLRDFTEWLGNGQPPWYAYRAFMTGRMIALPSWRGRDMALDNVEVPASGDRA